MNRKHVLKTMVLACLMALCSMPMSAQGSAQRGDLNGDGGVTIADVTMLIDNLMGGGDMTAIRTVADFNQDGDVTIADVTAMIDYLLTGEMPGKPYEPVIETFTVSGVTFDMLLVEGGTFTMGAIEGDPYVRPWESPTHEVTVSDYYIGVTEVTQALWTAVMGSNPSWFTSTNGYATDLQRPVERVTYSNCLAFIMKLNMKTGKTFRLLTEAEWEFAARGGNWSKGTIYAGSDNVEDVAWHNGNSGEIPHAVGTKAPNELGLYDMSGNMGEWTSDWYGLYTTDAQVDPKGPESGTARVVRGGSWGQAFRMGRVTSRTEGWPDSPIIHVGLRLAMSR